MSLLIDTEPIPLETDADGPVRVAGTRVTLDTVVAAFNEGDSAEGIVQQYPSLDLADVYAVIGYYLHHQDEVEIYLARRQEQAQEIRRMNEARFDPTGVRERLLAHHNRYTDAPTDIADATMSGEIVADFLPPPQELVLKNETADKGKR